MSLIFDPRNCIKGTIEVSIDRGPFNEGNKIYLTIKDLPSWLIKMIFDSEGFKTDSMGSSKSNDPNMPWIRVTLRSANQIVLIKEEKEEKEENL